MPFVLITILLLVLTIGTMQYTKQGFGVCLSVNAFGIVLIAYCCALANHLPLSVFLLRGLLIFDFGVCAYHLLQWGRKKASWNISVLPSVFFIALMGVLWYVARGRMYSDWDEFSFWGSSLKFVMYDDVLYTSDLFDNLFKTYPPAQILLQYGVMKAAGIAFREDVAIFLSSLPIVCAVMYPVDFFLKRKKYLAAFIGALFLMLSPAILETTAYTKTTVDLRLGAMVSLLIFAAALPGDRKAKIALFSVSGSVLTLYKTSGFALALLTLLLCGACLILQEKDRLKATSLRKKALTILADFLPVFVSAIVQFSWKYHIASRDLIENGIRGHR